MVAFKVFESAAFHGAAHLIAAARADGHIDEHERGKIAAHLTELGQGDAARFIDRGKCGPVIAAAVGYNLLGLLGVSFSTAFVPLLIGVFGAGAGYILVLQSLTAWIKNLYPEDQRGQFEGIKQLFFVCVPMIVAGVAMWAWATRRTPRGPGA